MSKKFSELMSKEMTRKQFVGVLGAAILAVFGITSILDALSGNSKVEPVSKYGYGTGPYGGTKDKLQ
jgi:hypothetical protein